MEFKKQRGILQGGFEDTESVEGIEGKLEAECDGSIERRRGINVRHVSTESHKCSNRKEFSKQYEDVAEKAMSTQTQVSMQLRRKQTNWPTSTITGCFE